MNEKFQIPKRWIPCPKFGERVEGTNFVPLKAPIGENYQRFLWDGHQFSFKIFEEYQKAKGRNIVMTISLANTTRFYDKSDITSGISEWIPCEGNKNPPNDNNFKNFKDKVLSLGKLNDSDIIAVHCTHGFNRTGFLIVRFLVEILNISIQEAINRFSRARPNGIYKSNYITKLEEIYQTTNLQWIPKLDWFHPNPLKLPKYILKEDEVIEFDSEQSTETNIGNIGKTNSVSTLYQISLVKSVNFIFFQNRSQKQKFNGSQPISLGIKEVNDIAQELETIKKYRATYKSDGVRYFLFAYNGSTYMADRTNEYRKVQCKLINKNGEPLNFTLLDGELVEEIHETKTLLNFLIFDVICYEFIDLTKNTWENRMDYAKFIIKFRNNYKEINKDFTINDQFDLSIKEQWPLNHLEELDNYMKSEVKHKTDGIIFTPLDMDYEIGQCDKILKWKPLDMNSVDFLIDYHENIFYLTVAYSSKENNVFHTENIPICTLEILNNNEKNDIINYIELGGKVVVECCFDVNETLLKNNLNDCWKLFGWKPMRKRTDKTEGNAYRTFVGVYRTIKDNVTIQTLIETFKGL